MYQKKPGAFMADWWDADGRRHRKQFSTSAAAREHEHRETALAHAERASREMKLAARTSSAKRSRSKAEVGTIEPAKGKLGIMIPGMGAVATTFVAGVEAVRKGLAKPIGSLTQMGTVRLGKRTDGRSPKVKEFVPLAGLDDLVFTGWDIFEDNMYEAATNAGVLDYRLLEQLKPFLSSIKPRRRRLRSQLREEDRRAQREEGQDEDGSGRAVARRHPRLQEDERRQPPGHHVVRFDRVVH